MKETEPVAVPVQGVVHRYGFTRSETYRRLAAGDFLAVKNGKRTLVLTESIRSYMAKLPAATFRAPKRVAA